MDLFFFLLFWGYSFFLFLIERRFGVYIHPITIIIPYSVLISTSYSPDTEAYIDFYQATNFDLFDFYGDDFAIGFQILTKILKIFSYGNYSVYMFELTLINVSLFMITINLVSKKCINKKISFLIPLIIYFSYYGIFYNAIVLRAGISLNILLLLYVLISIKSRHYVFDYILYGLLFILAYLFHTSTIIALLILVVLCLPHFQRKVYYVLLFVSIIFCYSSVGTSIMNYFYSFLIEHSFVTTNRETENGLDLLLRYGMTSEIGNVISFKFIFQIILAFIFLNSNAKFKLYKKLFNVYVIGLLIGSIGIRMETFGRVLDFFTFTSIILLWIDYVNSSNLGSLFKFSFVFFLQLFFVYRIINPL